MKKKYFIEIMKNGRSGKGKMPTTKKGKITINPLSKGYIHQLLANHGWMVTQFAEVDSNTKHVDATG